MQIDSELLTKLETLSHLRVADDKKEEIMRQLTDILGYVENLNELDTEGLDPFFSMLEGGTPMREDVTHKEENVAREILAHAPMAEEDFFIVPAIIE